MGLPDNTPPRRSTRPRKVPVSYAVPDEDQMDDVELLTQCQHQRQQPKKIAVSRSRTVKAESPDKHEVSSTIIRTRSMAVTRVIPSAAAGNPPEIYHEHQEIEPSDDSDGEYGVKPKKKKRKIAHLYEKIFVGKAEDKEEQALQKVCSGLGIPFSFFDSWVEDPKLKDPSKMNIPFLPTEIIVEIFGHCRSEVLVQCEKSCQRFKTILKDNTKIWCQARLQHYPYFGMGPELPYNLDEASLFELATEKDCDYCESEKARPYYAWSIRSCNECIKSLTVSISEFKKMFKKKCDDEEDWTPYRREQVCSAIHWHQNPNYSKICWREYAYNLIEEAEGEMLAGTFDEWIETKPKQRCKTCPLEEWGSRIPKKIAEDKRMDEVKVRMLRRAYFHDWCMRLPRPIPEKTLKQLNAYWVFIKTSSFPTKSEFIRQLPKLLRERDVFEEKERKKEELRALYRIRQDSVIDRTCSNIVQQVIKEGPLSATSWCAILRGALQQVSRTSIEINFPRGTPTILRRPEDWKSDWGGSHLIRLIDLLEDKLCPRLDTLTRGEPLHPASYEFFNNGEDRIFACPAAIIIASSTSHNGCKHKGMMNFQELISHLLSTHSAAPYGYGNPRCLWASLQKVIVVHPAVNRSPPLTSIGGKQYRQKELQVWFRPSPRMAGTEHTSRWMKYNGPFKIFMKKRMKSENPSIVANSEDGMPAAGHLMVNVHGTNKGGSKSSNGGRKSITTYFHTQKKPTIKAEFHKTRVIL